MPLEASSSKYARTGFSSAKEEPRHVTTAHSKFSPQPPLTALSHSLLTPDQLLAPSPHLERTDQGRAPAAEEDVVAASEDSKGHETIDLVFIHRLTNFWRNLSA